MTGEPEVQAQQIIMNWGKLTPDEVWARLDAIFRPRQESSLAQLDQAI
ncbi:MAG: hypothetical protein GY696_17550 [Gammaproteobacteria bacterium]|nr:hypothetical protein [Gammaproteobacteria bacterium]